jgi:hypothetical protein
MGMQHFTPTIAGFVFLFRSVEKQSYRPFIKNNELAGRSDTDELRYAIGLFETGPQTMIHLSLLPWRSAPLSITLKKVTVQDHPFRVTEQVDNVGTTQ